MSVIALQSKLYSLYTAVFLHADYGAVKFRNCSVKSVKKKVRVEVLCCSEGIYFRE
jgi:hypothetical protein